MFDLSHHFDSRKCGQLSGITATINETERTWKNIACAVGIVLLTAGGANADVVTFTAADAAGATLNAGTLAAITEPVDGTALTSQSYTVNGLTLDGDAIDDSVTITFTLAAFNNAGAATLNWDHTTLTVREYDHNNGVFNVAGEGATFGTITMNAGTTSDGSTLVLNSGVFTELTYRRWAGAVDEVTSVVGDFTNIADNTSGVVALNDTTFTTTHVSGGSWQILNYDLAIDVTAVPEPSSMALLGLGSLFLVSPRRR